MQYLQRVKESLNQSLHQKNHELKYLKKVRKRHYDDIQKVPVFPDLEITIPWKTSARTIKSEITIARDSLKFEKCHSYCFVLISSFKIKDDKGSKDPTFSYKAFKEYRKRIIE